MLFILFKIFFPCLIRCGTTVNIILLVEETNKNDQLWMTKTKIHFTPKKDAYAKSQPHRKRNNRLVFFHCHINLIYWWKFNKTYFMFTNIAFGINNGTLSMMLLPTRNTAWSSIKWISWTNTNPTRLNCNDWHSQHAWKNGCASYHILDLIQLSHHICHSIVFRVLKTVHITQGSAHQPYGHVRAVTLQLMVFIAIAYACTNSLEKTYVYVQHIEIFGTMSIFILPTGTYNVLLLCSRSSCNISSHRSTFSNEIILW